MLTTLVLDGVEITTTASLADVVSTIRSEVAQPKAVVAAQPVPVATPVQEAPKPVTTPKASPVKRDSQPKADGKPSSPRKAASRSKTDNKALLAEIRSLCTEGAFDKAIALIPSGWSQVVAEVERKRAGHKPAQEAAKPQATKKAARKSTAKPSVAEKASKPSDNGRALAEGKPGDKPLVEAKDGGRNVQQTVTLPAKLDTAEARLHDLYESFRLVDQTAFSAKLSEIESKCKDELKLIDQRKAMLVGLKADERFAAQQNDAFVVDEVKARCKLVAASVRRLTDKVDAMTQPKAVATA